MTIEHADIAIVGAGPAGLSAARTAARSGARVVLIDDNPRPGGQIWRQGPAFAPAARLRRWLDETRAQPNLVVMNATKVAAATGDRRLLLEREGEPLTLAWSKLILATGARERLLPFEGWTLPGVTGAGGLQALVKGGLPVRGERVVVAGSGPLLLAVAATARRHGADVRALIEQASFGQVAKFVGSLARTPGKLAQAAALGVACYRTASVVVKAHGAARVEAVTIRTRGLDTTIEADRVACGYGLVPNATLALALGCAIDEAGGAIRPADARPIRERERWRAFAGRVARAFELGVAARAMPPADTVLCRCEDVTLGAIASHADWRDAKLQTRCGMGPCQGRICGEAACLWFGWPRASARPPFVPIRIDTLIAARDAAAPPDA
ncbi:oxidoreductase [Caballeronia peredens]|nr:oxidoreductase [Caballeronia peredens]